jgi:hypothetical protein
VAKTENREQKRDFLKKAASNFSLADRNISYEFRKPWQLVADQRFPEANEKPAHVACAGLPTEIDLLAKMRSA